PVELRVLTSRALQRRPEDRWQTAAQFRDALDEWLRRTTGTSNRDLASLIGKVINAPTADLEQDNNQGVVRHPTGEEEALSGAMTRMSLMRAEAEAARARAAYISGEMAAIPAGEIGDPASSGVISVRDDDIVPDNVEVPSGPREVGDLREKSVVKVVYGLA